MKKKLVLIFVLITAIAVSGCIDSPMSNINKLMPDISNSIVSGDKYYNEAVNFLNNKDYDNAFSKANLASGEFNKSMDKIVEVNKYYNSINNDIYITYLNTVASEIQLKSNATEYLLLSINSFKENSTNEGNNYSLNANSFMNDALEYQNKRINIVNNNPDLFKEVFHF